MVANRGSACTDISLIKQRQMKNNKFLPGQIIKLDEPNLGSRSEWRYIILTGPIVNEITGKNCYDAYCIRAPRYRKESLGKIHTILECHLIPIE